MQHRSYTIFLSEDNPNDTIRKKLLDYVSIMEKVEDGIVYTVEGNSGDACRQRQYSVGYYEILGYGTPAY